MCQSRNKFIETARTGIHWIGKVADWKVLRRKEIQEISCRRGTEEELYVIFTVEVWEKRENPILLGVQGIYTVLHTSKYIFNRALEIAELRLETDEDLHDWREQRRQGRVKIKLDNEYVDLGRVVEVKRVGGGVTPK